ncbi:MAG: transposase [Lachnospiraceae bacterium]|nr:transposase [Lachnospiraceae bacterium]
MDDFAIRKRFSYGTVMVDLENHWIIDMIPSRDVADVERWLKEFPNVEVVSRDGAQIYASAVNGAHPQASQVSDGFHVINGLAKALEKYIIRTYPAKIERPTVTVQSEEMKQLLNVSNRRKRTGPDNPGDCTVAECVP